MLQLEKNCWKKIVGKHSLHEITNENGIRLINLATATDLKIVSTSFPRKNIHKITWISPDGNVKNQIDHVLIDTRHKNWITNVRSIRGAECGTDHNLVVVKMKQCIKIIKTGKIISEKKIDISKLSNTNIQKEYRIKISNRFQVLSELEKDENLYITNDDQIEEKRKQQIETGWKIFQKVVKETATEICGNKKQHNNKPWFNDECKSLIEKRRITKISLLNDQKIENAIKYKKINSEVNKFLRNQKRQYIKQQLTKAEEDSDKNNTREFYKKIKYFKNGFTAKTTGIKNRKGEIISGKKIILNTWKEHFEELLNNTDEIIEETTNYCNDNQPLIEDPTLEEITKLIQKQRNGKAPGEDKISIELIKNGGLELYKYLHKLILNIWKYEKIPEEWTEAIIMPLFKKGDKQECSNYRGISLLNTAYKIFSKLVQQRLKPYTENIIKEHQAGFCTERSTTDQIYILKEIIAKNWEFNKNTHLLFIDFHKAFDSVIRNKLWEHMQKYGIPDKLIRLSKLCITQSKGKIKIDNDYSEIFRINSGVRQGDGLSPTLFNIALEKTLDKIEDLNLGINIGKKINILAYAHDIVITADNENDLKSIYKTLKIEAEEVGLLINPTKTKHMLISRNNKNNNKNLIIDNISIESVKEFCYLGVLINNRNEEEQEIKYRIMKANRAYFDLNKVLASKLISRRTKIRIYKTIIYPILTYGSETWILNKKEEKQLIVFENKILRKIFGPINEENVWRRRHNYEIRELYKDPDIIAELKSKRLRWAGHILRKKDDSLANLWNSTIEGKRPTGRPRSRWRDQVMKDVRRMKRDVCIANNRKEWRKLVDEAKNLLGFQELHE